MLAIHSFFSEDVEINMGEDSISLSTLFIHPSNIVCLAQDDDDVIIILLSNGTSIYISNYDGEEHANLKTSIESARS